MDKRLWLFLAALAAVGLWSGHAPQDRLTWWLEVAPVWIAVPIILLTRQRFPLSSLLLVLIVLHGWILMVGGHYTYALTPLGEWAKDWFGWTRNNYDKLGHFAQGFVPALVCREVLSRATPLRGHAGWIAFLSGSTTLAVSASYELIEWLTALTSGEAAEAFLGTQGYVWDTQSDMAIALVGAICALVLMARWHDRSMAAIQSDQL